MSYMDEIFTRVNIQQIREFLLHGSEEGNIDTGDYKQRLETAQKAATRYLRSFYDDNDKYEELSTTVFDYIDVVQNIYMEIGLQCGFMLGMQFATNTKMSFTDEGKTT